MLTQIMKLEIKVREVGLFFLANSGRIAENVEKLHIENELDELLVSFKQILELEVVKDNLEDRNDNED